LRAARHRLDTVRRGGAASVAGVPEPPRFRQLLPTCAQRDAAELLEAAFAALTPPAQRPYTLANFIASVDGRAAFEGSSLPLGDAGDRALFFELRERVDAVLVGTGTFASEPYGRLLSRPERRERRRARGLAPEPLTCLVTRSGRIDTGARMLACPQARVVIFSAAEVTLDGVAAQVQVVRCDPEQLTLGAALAALRAEHGVRMLLCEGGPTLFAALLAERLVDELFLTIAPRLSGGGREPAITSGPAAGELLSLRLLWLLERDGYLYARYALSPNGGWCGI